MTIKQLLAILISLIITVSAWCRSEPLCDEENDSTASKQQAFVFLSDTQKPMWFEKIFVKTHRNEEATKILLNTIVMDSAISSVFHFGDVTAMSSFDFYWTTIDSFLNRLKRNNVSVYAAAGNHDYLLTSGSGETHFLKRFPDFKRTGYTIRKGKFALVFLNSNFGELTPLEKTRQQEWYLNELQSLEQDSTIKLVAVGCHHPPFSNSAIVGHSQQVRDMFVPPFLKSGKCRLFLSGHAHTFQHFKDTVTNKHFLVIGGGGGLLHTLKAGNPDELQDQVHWSNEYRMFHFVRGVLTADGLLLNVMMLTEDLTGPRSVYEVFIPLDNHESTR
jgi:predicted phosphodiesterase